MHHSSSICLTVHMVWARKWWLANAFLVASTLRILFGLPAIIFVERTLANADRRTVSCRKRISNFAMAHDGAVRALFTMMVVLLASCVGFGTYWHWYDKTSLTKGIIASSDCTSQSCAKSKRAFNMEVIVAFALPLLVTVSIYVHRWNNRAMIGGLNSRFRFIYDNHQKSHHSQRQCCFWDQYGRLALKQVFEVMALGVLWLNLKPLNDTEQDRNVEDYRIGKLISSMGSMLPAVVCLLVSIEMGINFSFIARTLTTLNWSVDSLVRSCQSDSVRKKVKHGTKLELIEEVHAANEYSSCNVDFHGYFRKLIAAYDKLGHVMEDMVQLYSPNLLLIIGMHFVLFTMQVTTLSLIVNRVQDGINLFGYFDLDRSLVMTVSLYAPV
uniref:Gustatory receptor n=1 Tax=Anopheles christyi TaxID=43041 RepID=A0A182K282_9DIPT